MAAKYIHSWRRGKARNTVYFEVESVRGSVKQLKVKVNSCSEIDYVYVDVLLSNG